MSKKNSKAKLRRNPGVGSNRIVRQVRFKSLTGAEKRVRQLEKQVKDRDSLLARFDNERRLMAKLAADTPQFFNPLIVMEAKQIRDHILSLPND